MFRLVLEESASVTCGQSKVPKKFLTPVCLTHASEVSQECVPRSEVGARYTATRVRTSAFIQKGSGRNRGVRKVRITSRRADRELFSFLCTVLNRLSSSKDISLTVQRPWSRVRRTASDVTPTTEAY